MSYTPETLEKANEIIEQRKADALAIQQMRHTKVVTQIPNIAQYEAQMADSGLEVIKALAMGENAEKYIEELSEMNLRIQGYIKDELVKAGYAADYLDTPYTCKKCSDTGYVGAYVCDCKKQLLAQLNLESLWKISPAEKCTFDNFKLDYYSKEIDPRFGMSSYERMSDILEYCKCYAEDFDLKSNSLYMYGATGLGKTHLSLAIANVVAQKGYNIVYGSAQNLLSGLEREKFSYKDTNEQEKRLVGCDLLIIDDLGSEFCTQYTVSAIYDIINTRINLDRPVILSTNLTQQEVEAKYTQRLSSRINGTYTSLPFAGSDVRVIKNNL